MTKPPTQINGVRVTSAGRALHGHAAKRGGVDLRAVRPSAAIRDAFQKRLDALVDAMHTDAAKTLTAAYRSEMALDASPAAELRRVMRKLARRWVGKFDELAPKLAEYFAKAAHDRTDAELKAMLRKAGFTVKFKMSAAMQNSFQAVVGENVALITSIATKYLDAVEAEVMRSVQKGRDLHGLAKALEQNYGVTKRRAALIARNQNNMATATMTKTRQAELGIKKARWLHSAGGKTPRPEHVAFSGHIYDVEKGAFLEGKWTWPGMEINCRCVSVPIIPGFD